MFSTGQLTFAAFFAVSFIMIIILSYRKDLKLHRKNYKGVKWIGAFFMIFIFTLFMIRFLLEK